MGGGRLREVVAQGGSTVANEKHVGISPDIMTSLLGCLNVKQSVFSQMIASKVSSIGNQLNSAAPKYLSALIEG